MCDLFGGRVHDGIMLESELMSKMIAVIRFQVHFDWVVITDLQSLNKIN